MPLINICGVLRTIPTLQLMFFAHSAQTAINVDTLKSLEISTPSLQKDSCLNIINVPFVPIYPPHCRTCLEEDLDIIISAFIHCPALATLRLTLRRH